MRWLPSVVGALMAATLWAGLDPSLWREIVNEQRYHNSAMVEVKTKAGVADLVSAEEVLMLSRPGAASAALGKLEKMAKATDKRPVLAIVEPTAKDKLILKSIDEQAESAGVDLLLLRIDISPLGGVADSPATPPTPTQNQTNATADTAKTGYWLNTESNIRHNSKCRYYGKGKNSRPCQKDEGKPCKVCGG
jgi:hypothetical protein